MLVSPPKNDDKAGIVQSASPIGVALDGEGDVSDINMQSQDPLDTSYIRDAASPKEGRDAVEFVDGVREQVLVE